MRIMWEFIEGFDTLASVDRQSRFRFGAHRPGGSPYDARWKPRAFSPRRASRSSPAPGRNHGGREQGAKLGGGRSIGCNIELPFEQGANPYVVRSSTSGTSSSARRCSSSTGRVIIFPAALVRSTSFEALTLFRREDLPVPRHPFGATTGLGCCVAAGAGAERGKNSEGDLDRCSSPTIRRKQSSNRSAYRSLGKTRRADRGNVEGSRDGKNSRPAAVTAMAATVGDSRRASWEGIGCRTQAQQNLPPKSARKGVAPPLTRKEFSEGAAIDPRRIDARNRRGADRRQLISPTTPPSS